VPVVHSALVMQRGAAPVGGHAERQDDPVSAEVVSNCAQQVQPGAQLVESPQVSRAYTPVITTPTQPVRAGKQPVGKGAKQSGQVQQTFAVRSQGAASELGGQSMVPWEDPVSGEIVASSTSPSATTVASGAEAPPSAVVRTPVVASAVGPRSKSDPPASPLRVDPPLDGDGTNPPS